MEPLSLGVDIVDIGRVRRLATNPRFLSRVFTDGEVDYCRSKRNAAQHFAARFAAKEAVYKALGIPGLAHRDIAVWNEPSGKPRVSLAKTWRKWEPRLTLSLSHTDTHAVAVAIVRRR